MFELYMVISLITKISFYVENKEFIDTVNKQTEGNPNLEWVHTGKQKPSPGAKSITLRDTKGKPFILYKLVPGERPYHLREE